MLRTSLSLALALTVAAWAGAQQPEQKLSESAQKAKEVVDAHLKKINGTNGTVVWINDESLAKTFPKHTFFAVRYRQYPQPVQAPEGLRASNIFAVTDGKLEHLKDAKTLEAFFKANASAITTEDAAKQAIHSWLWLAQEFVQDGFYTFEIDKGLSMKGTTSEKDGGKILEVGTRAIVMKGGNGEIRAVIKLGDKGKVAGVSHEEKVKQGPRPICQ